MLRIDQRRSRDPARSRCREPGQARRSRPRPPRRRRPRRRNVSATTQATRSPTNRTLSTGNGGRSTGFSPSIGGATRSVVAALATSAPVHTATTPGRVRAAAVSIRSMRAWACGLRTNTACSAPATAMSPTKRPRPVTRRTSSRRATASPIPPAVFGGGSRGARACSLAHSYPLILRCPSEARASKDAALLRSCSALRPSRLARLCRASTQMRSRRTRAPMLYHAPPAKALVGCGVEQVEPARVDPDVDPVADLTRASFGKRTTSSTSPT